ncbi:hypothetical protein NOJ05_01165 [Neorhizobium galegae]|uniref:hypothetical protein n=1 Tax=Neorhizobium galegae TaxID=399 RepID=UPI0021084828|nr:hypothetical protein [Neorhizobium galegae]MCQ1798018.1 hypothetical protein [Neorhizobium galegae]
MDFQGGTITIQQTKFYKTRILPLPDSVMVELRSYTEARHRAGESQDPSSGLFWHEQCGDRYSKEAVAWLLVDVIRCRVALPHRHCRLVSARLVMLRQFFNRNVSQKPDPVSLAFTIRS